MVLVWYKVFSSDLSCMFPPPFLRFFFKTIIMVCLVLLRYGHYKSVKLFPFSRTAFTPFGEISDVKVMKDPETNKPKVILLLIIYLLQDSVHALWRNIKCSCNEGSSNTNTQGKTFSLQNFFLNFEKIKL